MWRVYGQEICSLNLLGHFGMHPKRYGIGFANKLNLYQLFAFDTNSVGSPVHSGPG